MAISDENVNISFNLVPEKQVEAAIANDYTRIDWTGRSTKNIATATGQIRESIAQGIREGQDYSQMANAVSDRMGKSAADMQRIARTEGHRCREQGNLDSLNFAHKKGLNLEKEWVAALDERTRDAHATLDGQTVGINEEFVSPAGGKGQGPGLMGSALDDINCRCSLVGVTPGEKFEYRGYRYDDAPGSFIGKYSNYMDWAKKKGIKPHLFTDIAEPRVLGIIDFIPATSKEDALKYLGRYVDNVNLEGASLDQLNEISRAMHATRQGHDFKTEVIQWKPAKGGGRGTAKHVYSRETGDSLRLEIQKTAVTSSAKQHAKMNTRWEQYHATDLAKKAKTLSYGDELYDYDKAKRAFANTSVTPRWSWSQDAKPDDYIMSLIAHENGHAIEMKYKLAGKFDDALLKNNVARIDAFKVSEYAASHNDELFAEITSAIAQGRQNELPANVLKAYNETISTIVR